MNRKLNPTKNKQKLKNKDRKYLQTNPSNSCLDIIQNKLYIRPWNKILKILKKLVLHTIFSDCNIIKVGVSSKVHFRNFKNTFMLKKNNKQTNIKKNNKTNGILKRTGHWWIKKRWLAGQWRRTPLILALRGAEVGESVRLRTSWSAERISG